MVSEIGEFFSASAVDVRITLLESDNNLACFQAGKAHGEEFFLRLFCVAGEFAGDVDFCAAGDEIEDGSWDEFVGEDEVCALNGAVSGYCQEIWTARARASEDYSSFSPSIV